MTLEEESVLDFIDKNPRCTRQDIQFKFGISLSKVNSILMILSAYEKIKTNIFEFPNRFVKV